MGHRPAGPGSDGLRSDSCPGAGVLSPDRAASSGWSSRLPVRPSLSWKDLWLSMASVHRPERTAAEGRHVPTPSLHPRGTQGWPPSQRSRSRLQNWGHSVGAAGEARTWPTAGGGVPGDSGLGQQEHQAAPGGTSRGRGLGPYVPENKGAHGRILGSDIIRLLLSEAAPASGWEPGRQRDGDTAGGARPGDCVCAGWYDSCEIPRETTGRALAG